ncbi:PIG-M-domain-containing protein [Sordaria brevicollis]|uniref:GPI mannosyltransferase 1 n=1 Tax=Sordaria brevicollis TaxID=83679 RepID=A0AAE0P154_SORBR|nr:PIG-M-domain-containing protein [Sordaria brevicollis]
MATSPATPKIAKSSLLTTLFSRPLPLYLSAFLLRLILLLYGLWQDANSPLKYTDIDYLVFTDAARFVSRGESPYARETYRYTPILAWLLLPTTCTAGAQWGPLAAKVINAAWFSFGKVLFAAADLVAGWLIERVLVMGTDFPGPTTSFSQGNGTATKKHEEEVNDEGKGMAPSRARAFAAIWLLNPMVATISTRGSSEGLLGVLVMALLWAVLSRRITLAGLLLGFSVHFKIYPFIYAPAIVWWMDAERFSGVRETGQKTTSFLKKISSFLTLPRLQLALTSLLTFFGLNMLMYALYGHPFLQETYLHHVTRIDHRHNFSPYNTQLYLSSASITPLSTTPAGSQLKIESLAFLPQLLLSTVLIPFVLAKKDLPTSLLAQTFAFVTFNKVCTSQYFLWYMVFLPLYLPRSSFLKNMKLGVAALGLWVLGQGLWLQQGFELEFLGRSTFLPGLWMASLGFFVVNCWILGVIVGDGGGEGRLRGDERMFGNVLYITMVM